MNKKLNISITEALGGVLAFGLAVSAAHAYDLSHDMLGRNLLGQGGGIWIDKPDGPGSPVAHTDQGPVKSGTDSFAGIMAPPGRTPGSSGPLLSGDLGAGLDIDSDLLSFDAVLQGPASRFPTVGPLTLFDFEEFTAMKHAEASASAAPGPVGVNAIPSPGSIVLIGVAGSIAGLRRKRAR